MSLDPFEMLSYCPIIASSHWREKYFQKVKDKFAKNKVWF